MARRRTKTYDPEVKWVARPIPGGFPWKTNRLLAKSPAGSANERLVAAGSLKKWPDRMNCGTTVTTLRGVLSLLFTTIENITY